MIHKNKTNPSTMHR